MSDLQTLLDQQAELARKIESMRGEARSKAISQIKALMAEYEMTAADLVEAPRAKPAGKKSGPSGKVAAKYRNSATGDSWSGRGLKPRWLKAELAAGRTVEDFAV